MEHVVDHDVFSRCPHVLSMIDACNHDVMIKYHIEELKYRVMYVSTSIGLTMLILWDSKEKIIYSITSLNLIYTEL